MLSFIRLLRPVNLFVIAFTMYVIRYAVIGQSWWKYRSEGQGQMWKFPVSDGDFALLVLSALFIAAAGYIINDYFDIRIDRVNKPQRVIVGNRIKKRTAMLTHIVFNLLGVGIGFYLSIKYRNPAPLAVHLFTTTALWLYSLQMKRRFLSGNLSISVLAALVPLLVLWMEMPALKSTYNHPFTGYPFSRDALSQAGIYVWGFALFAFLSTLIREIQKDMADVKGDAVVQCKTVPLVWGMEKTRRLVLVLLVLIILSIVILLSVFFAEWIYALYILLLVVLPLLISGGLTRHAKTRKEYLQAAQFVKFAMFTGVLFSIILL